MYLCIYTSNHHLMIRLILSFLIASTIFITSARAEVTVGASHTSEYIPELRQSKARVGLFTNHTGLVGSRHILDILIDSGIDVRKIFTPEHGFRGSADAGEHVKSDVDSRTGIPIASLYGSGAKAALTAESLKDIDVIITDIQDVGLRFYTYYCTMLDLMKAAGANGKSFIILDRPNPNGMTVDGPILDMKYASGVGRLPIPVCHGMTLGELALFAVGEGCINGCDSMPLKVVKCGGYTHSTRYALPVPPSPNLPDMKSIYLYPSMCYFEATSMSLGRGTDMPFCVYGHPSLKGKMNFSFTPRSRTGAKRPPLMNLTCYGRDLRTLSDDEIISAGVNLEYLIEAYRLMGKNEKFLTSFFEKLIGNGRIRAMITSGKSAAEIKASWKAEVEEFKNIRNKYLIYPE